VRTSWAKAASAASTIPDPAGFKPLPRLRAGFLADLAARFLAGRFFGGRPLRVGRDLAAMILRPRIEPA
jgi:hypothetical protein